MLFMPFILKTKVGTNKKIKLNEQLNFKKKFGYVSMLHGVGGLYVVSAQ
jgi:hypothetical protein